jgi:DNA-binding transcriptional MerR regulator
MNVSRLAELISRDSTAISSDTLRKWGGRKEYGTFLSPTATPTSGQQRVYTEHDAAVLNYVAVMRDKGTPHPEIKDTLKQWETEDWASLPAAPATWFNPVQAVPVDEAVQRAGQVAQAIVLKAELDRALTDLETMRTRVEELEAELAKALEEKGTADNEVQKLQLDLAEAKAAVAAYTVGGEVLSPITFTLRIALVVIAVTLVLVVIGIVISRLL